MRVRPVVVVLFGVFVLGWSAFRERPQTPTFTKDVAPILYKNCSQCHRPNEVAPMSLMTYDEGAPVGAIDQVESPEERDAAVGRRPDHADVQQRSADERQGNRDNRANGWTPARRRATTPTCRRRPPIPAAGSSTASPTWS